MNSIDDLHREMDRLAKRLQNAKHYRGGTLQGQLADIGDRLHDMAAAIRANYEAFS